MKIKFLAFLLFVLPISSFALTNAFDSVLVKTTLQLTFGTPGAGKVLTSDANGYGTWSTVMSAGGGDVFTASNNVFLANNTFNSNVISTNGVNGASTNFLSTIRLFQTASDGVYMTLVSTNAGAMPGMLSGDTTGNTFSWRTTNGNADITWNMGTASITMMGGNYTFLNNGLSTAAGVTITHAGIVQLTSNLVVDANTTLGDGASRTLTINGTTVTAPNMLNFNANTLVVTNQAVWINTNNFPTTAALFIRGSSASQSGLIVRGFESPGSTHTWRIESPTGTFQMGGTSNGTFLIGAAQFTTVGINLINASGEASIVNNTASTGSSFTMGAGTGAGARALIKASGTTVGNFSTNQVNLNGVNFSATTNSTLMGPFLRVSGNVIPGSIAANTTYVTNFALANAVTNGGYFGIKPPFFENINFIYEVGCPSNGFVQVYIHNKDLVSAHTASNGVYGVTGIMPSL